MVTWSLTISNTGRIRWKDSLQLSEEKYLRNRTDNFFSEGVYLVTGFIDETNRLIKQMEELTRDLIKKYKIIV